MLHPMNTIIKNDDGSISKPSVVSLEKVLGIWITFKPDFTTQRNKASAKAGLIKRTFTLIVHIYT